MRSQGVLWVAIAVLFFTASSASAAEPELAAGFAPDSIWLSKTTLVSGDTVRIFTVVYNSSASPINGDVSFAVDEKALGAVHFTLAAGETQVVSQEWKATIGSHQFSATVQNVTDNTKQVIFLAHAKTGSIDRTVAPAPPPSQLKKYFDDISALLASATPVVAENAATLFERTETIRENGAAYFEERVGPGASTGSQTTPAPGQKKIARASGYSLAAANIADSGSVWTKSAGNFNGAMATVFGSPLYFYSFFGALFLTILYFIRRMLRR